MTHTVKQTRHNPCLMKLLVKCVVGFELCFVAKDGLEDVGLEELVQQCDHLVLVWEIKVIAVLQLVEEPNGRLGPSKRVFIVAQKVSVALHWHLHSENVYRGIPLEIVNT
jgi:hypothetical protein